MSLSMKTLDRICFYSLLLVILIGGYLVGNGWIKSQKREVQEAEQISRRSAELNQVENDLLRLQRALDVRREKMKAMQEDIPGPVDMGPFLKELNALIKKNSIALTGIRPMSRVKEEHHTRIPVHLECTGSFERIYGLLRDLEGMEGLLWMEKMVISRLGAAQECGLELTMNILGYENRTSFGKGA